MLCLLVDRNDSFRGVEALPADRSEHIGNFRRLRLYNGLCPEVNAVIRRLDHVARDTVRPVPGLKLPDKLLILRPVHCLEVVPGCIIADHRRHRQLAQLVFGDAERHDGRMLRAHPAACNRW